MMWVKKKKEEPLPYIRKIFAFLPVVLGKDSFLYEGREDREIVWLEFVYKIKYHWDFGLTYRPFGKTEYFTKLKLSDLKRIAQEHNVCLDRFLLYLDKKGFKYEY